MFSSVGPYGASRVVPSGEGIAGSGRSSCISNARQAASAAGAGVMEGTKRTAVAEASCRREGAVLSRYL